MPYNEKGENLIQVTEIFGPTLQGEGALCGVRTMFIRFAGCDYRCKMCDSMHAVDPTFIKATAKTMTAKQIVEAVKDLLGDNECSWVTFSGGNPLLWDLSELVRELTDEGFLIAVETQGTMYRDWLHSCHLVTVSPKGPGMGQAHNQQDFANFMAKLAARYDHEINEPGFQIAIKVVVFSQNDLEFAYDLKDWMAVSGYDADWVAYYLSLGNSNPPEIKRPAGESGLVFDTATSENFLIDLLKNYKMLAEDILQDPRFVDWIFLPQLHVLTWANDSGR